MKSRERESGRRVVRWRTGLLIAVIRDGWWIVAGLGVNLARLIIRPEVP
jgi:hypothetical protein